jgi:hypothetical protein
MHVFVEAFGRRLMVEIEHTSTVKELKEAINQILQMPLSPLPQLTFNSIELLDHLPLSSYNIQRESLIHCMSRQSGYSIAAENVKQHVSSPETLQRENTNWEHDELGEKEFYSFKPILDPSKIPFYEDVVKQTYHHGLTDKDQKWIKKYTGKAYNRLKVQAYTLDPDPKQLAFLKGLFLSCWAAYQTDLPSTVYHILMVTEKSFSWYVENMIFYTPAFISTSRKDDFKWKGNCKWEITLTKGNRHHAVDVKQVSCCPWEDEILISCCTRFKVLKAYKNHKGYDFYVYLEYLDI